MPTDRGREELEKADELSMMPLEMENPPQNCGFLSEGKINQFNWLVKNRKEFIPRNRHYLEWFPNASTGLFFWGGGEVGEACK